MTRNFIDLDELHEMFTAAGIEHRYTHGDTVITVIRGAHIWTVSENDVIYWGDGINVCEPRCREFSRTSDAYSYIMGAYDEVM